MHRESGKSTTPAHHMGKRYYTSLLITGLIMQLFFLQQSVLTCHWSFGKGRTYSPIGMSYCMHVVSWSSGLH